MRALPVALASAALATALSGLLPTGSATARPIYRDDDLATLRAENKQLKSDLSYYQSAYDELNDGLGKVERAADRLRDRRAGAKIRRIAENAQDRAAEYVGSYEDGYYGDDSNGTYRYQVTDADFDTMGKRVADATYADDQLALVKQLAASNWFSVSQVVGLMKLCSFEDTRIDVAVALYPRIVDPQNWYLVNDGFTYSSSKQSLRDRIGQ
jgi:hypothetical protein